MKKRKNRELGKKLMSSVIALTMMMGVTPGIALAASASVDEKIVRSLAKLYDGDDERARQELEALYQAGIIDENGNMVDLDIREDGEAVSLEDICARINAGEKTGDLTVNGHATTQEQLCKIQAVKSALEVAKLLAEDVEITDEHVENLESLLNGIADGSIDVDSAIKNGTLSVGGKRIMSSAKGAPMRGTGDSDFPETMTSTGEIEADADGKYTDNYISDSAYEDSHEFQLSDPENKTYYTDSPFRHGTLTIPAGQTKATSSLLFAPGWSVTDPWYGTRAFVINVSNVKGAVLEDNKATSSQTILLKADDSQAKKTVKSLYSIAEELGTVTADMAASTNYTRTGTSSGSYYQQFGGPVTQYKAGDYLRFIVHLKNQKAGSDLRQHRTKTALQLSTASA